MKFDQRRFHIQLRSVYSNTPLKLLQSTPSHPLRTSSCAAFEFGDQSTQATIRITLTRFKLLMKAQKALLVKHVYVLLPVFSKNTSSATPNS